MPAVLKQLPVFLHAMATASFYCEMHCTVTLSSLPFTSQLRFVLFVTATSTIICLPNLKARTRSPGE